MQCRQYFEENKTEIVPNYMVAEKETVKESEPAKWTRKPNIPEVTKSWHNFKVKEVIQDFQSTCLTIQDGPYDKECVRVFIN